MLEPRQVDGGTMLRSSRAMKEEVVAMLEDARPQLLDMARHIGLSRHEQRIEVNKLNGKVAGYWTEKLQQTKREMEELQAEIESIKRENEAMAKQIGTQQPNNQEGKENRSDVNVPLLTILKLQESKQLGLEEQRSKLLSLINQAILDLNQLNKHLKGGIDINTLDNPDTHEPEHHQTEQRQSHPAFQIHEPLDTNAEDLSHSALQRIRHFQSLAQQQFQHRQEWVMETIKACNDMLTHLDLKPGCYGYPPADAVVDESVDDMILNSNGECPGVGWPLISHLRERENQLLNLTQSRTSQLKQLAKSITNLWNTLQTPSKERETFLKQNSGLTLATLDACSNELERLEVLKSEHLRVQIGLQKQNLVALWEEVGISGEERDAFSPFHASSFSDETLHCIKNEVGRLDGIAEVMRPLLKLITERENILQDLRDLEESSIELGAKRFSIPGRMLLEEKVRNKAKRQLPKINSKLQAGLKDWENDNQKAFLWNGQHYLEIVQKSMESKKSRRSRAHTIKRGGRR